MLVLICRKLISVPLEPFCGCCCSPAVDLLLPLRESALIFFNERRLSSISGHLLLDQALVSVTIRLVKSLRSQPDLKVQDRFCSSFAASLFILQWWGAPAGMYWKSL